MMNNKYVTLSDFLTDDQLKKAIELKKARDICDKIIAPNLKEINKKLGQENDALYLAYAVEYALNQVN